MFFSQQVRAARDLICQVRLHGVAAAETFLALDRDNPLAKKNGFGRALFFIDPHTPPHTNVELLSLYLKGLDLLRRMPQQASHRDTVADCATLAAHYVLECDWFGMKAQAGVLPREWILLGNNLRRLRASFDQDLPQQAEVCQRALARLADCAAASLHLRRQPSWLCMTLAQILVCCIDDPACLAHLDRLATRISSGSIPLSHLETGHQASLAQVFAMATHLPSCLAALIKLATAVRMPATMPHWRVTTLVKGLAAALHERPCRAALNRAARFLREPHCYLRAYSIRDLCDIGAAFAQLPDHRDCRHALRKMAVYISAQPARLYQLEPGAINWVVNAIAAPPATGVPDTATRDRDDLILARIAERSDLLVIAVAALTPQATHAMLRAVADDASVGNAATALLMCRIISSNAPASLSLSDLATMVQVMARWTREARPAQYRRQLARELPQRDCETLIGDAALLSKLVEGLSEGPADTLCDQVLYRLALALAHPATSVDDIPAQALSLLTAFMGQHSAQAEFLPAVLKVAAALNHAPADDILFDLRYQRALCPAMAAWRAEPACRRALALLAACTATGAPEPGAYDADTIVALLQAFSLAHQVPECTRAAYRLVDLMDAPAFDRRQVTSAHRHLIWQAIQRWPRAAPGNPPLTYATAPRTGPRDAAGRGGDAAGGT